MSIITTKKRNRQPFRRRSSRGTDLMNYMEMYCSPQILSGSGKTLKGKLEILAHRFNNNRFYKGLLAQKKPLTTNQVNRIDLDYNQKILNR